jgi:uncharacterized protein YggE
MRSRLVPTIVCTAAALVVFSSASPQAATSSKARERTIEAVGTAEVMGAPDRVSVGVAVESRAKTAAAAASMNARDTQAVMDALKAKVGAGGKVETASYTLHAEYEYRQPDNRRELIGYWASNAVTATSDDLDAAGAMIDAALAAGANSINSIGFYLHDDAEIKRQALLEAGRRARQKAETIAESLGVGLGDLLSATAESEAAPPIPGPIRMRMSAQVEAMDSSTPIAAGELSVEMAVRVVFEVR